MEIEREDDRLEKVDTKTPKTKKSKSKRKLSNSHIVKKRTPFQYPKQKNEVYANNKTNFKAQLKQCERILDSGAQEVIIHGLGAAINRACSLALHLKEIHHETLDLDTKISSVTLTDDLEPKTDDASYEIKERKSSAIRIRVFLTAFIGSLRFDNTQINN
ncbi:ribonuclease P protein subunit p20 [Phymastichus coffea]|uniref:ribonuclease P protein subunit p20 n=1 Tax=Phymastichus coffea TaxID=108790 RepID=UPI00273A9A8E|nr:ribonuclease P protein subunit p20 [Phymastichus coffea]